MRNEKEEEERRKKKEERRKKKEMHCGEKKETMLIMNANAPERTIIIYSF